MEGPLDLATFGWDDGWAAALADLQDPELAPARVTASYGSVVTIHTGESVPVAGAMRGHGGSAAETPACGDWVAMRDGAVRALLPRRTLLARGDETAGDEALAANVDVLAIVSSLNQDLNARRVERFVALARGGGIEPLLVLSKGDLSQDPVAEAERFAERVPGADVIVLSGHHGWGVQALRARMEPRKTTALVGMSGVGKSTLVNLLLGEERQRTLTVREDDARGRHATTQRELFVLDDGALLIDTPGVRSPGLATSEGVDETFADVHELAAGCRFSDCQHAGEPGCAVAEAIASGDLDPARLDHMRKLEREGMTAQERRERSRDFHRKHRKEISARTRRR